MSNPFGATVQGTLDYVPELRLNPIDDAPTVETFIGAISPMVATSLGFRLRALEALAPGSTEGAEVLAESRDSAKGLVQLGAAALLQDSRYPELAASSKTDQAYGATLWARFQEALTATATGLDEALERLGGDPSAAGAEIPDVSAPPAFFHDRQRW